MTRRGLLALTIALLLAACGGPGSGAPQTSGASAPSPTAPSPAAPSASVAASAPASAALSPPAPSTAKSTPRPTRSPSTSPTPAPRDLVRVIVELDDAAFADDVLAAFPDATNVRRTQYSPLIILEVPESRLPALRRQPHVEHVTIDAADPPSG